MPIYTWALVMGYVLNKVWRRHRLAQHGLNPNLVDARNREKNARLHEDYARALRRPPRRRRAGSPTQVRSRACGPTCLTTVSSTTESSIAASACRVRGNTR